MTELVITAANSITAVGHDGRMTAASVRAGVCRMFCYDRFMDASDNPITVAGIKGIEDDNKDTAARLGIIAERCLAQMLDEYFREPRRRPAHVTLLLGVACEGRPRPRYEERSIPMLLRAMQRWTNKADLQAVPHGNASMPHAIAEAARLIDTSPGTLCIIGGIDSLIRDSTLSWFESDRRLKSRSYGRQHGLIAGEAVSFLFVEGQARAAQQEKPVLARVTGVGVAEEPAPRISGRPEISGSARPAGQRSPGRKEASPSARCSRI